MRIGDSERDAAVSALRDHHVAGRLTAEEFDERMSSALAAHTRGELDALFTDLPQDPSQPAVVTPAAGLATPSSAGGEVERSGGRKGMDLAAALAWPAALVFCFATGWQWWWVMLIPIFIMPVLAGHSGHHHGDNHQRRDRRGEIDGRK